ncbi:gem-associated protein 7 (Gemin7) domain-containing protein [Ditylenchus destructor]|uniref:Gem-associated protein 7 (Gemin7) domain-containing protein n=1 Tax=Ditylenchus destructor TaxID=166010 RepID=A0AAD4N7T8_9BILA|nr:gem-associated protein 7 (Gemin7) domain-containing protein [Ditylenchus destructor]
MAEGEQLSEEEQKANAELREQYLRFLSKLGGKKVDIHLFQHTKVRGKFVAVQSDQSHYLVDSLETPTGTMEHSALRMRDTVSISISFENF